jgi:hypothetical protein
MLNPFRWTAEDWTAVATCGTLLVAAVAAAFAIIQVRDARKLREDQARPFVVVDLQSSLASTHLVNLVIENVGKTLARDVRIKFSPAIKSTLDTEERKLADSALLRNGVPAMPPGRKITALLDASHQRVRTTLPSKYTATVYCDDANGKPQEPLEYVLDMGIRYGVLNAEVLGVHDIAITLKNMSDHFRQWSDVDGIRVWARDGDKWDSAQESIVDEEMPGGTTTKRDPA